MTPGQILHHELIRYAKDKARQSAIECEREQIKRFRRFSCKLQDLYPRLDDSQLLVLLTKQHSDTAYFQQLFLYSLRFVCIAVWSLKSAFSKFNPFELFAVGALYLYERGLSAHNVSVSTVCATYFIRTARGPMIRFIRHGASSIGARAHDPTSVVAFLSIEVDHTVAEMPQAVDNYIYRNGCDYMGGDTRSPEELLIEAETAAVVRSRLQGVMLSAREQSILEQRWLTADASATLADISHDWGVSPERVRQVESQLKRRLADLWMDLA